MSPDQAIKPQQTTMGSQKLPFATDYMYLCHPAILKRMTEISDTAYMGYGFDEICLTAKEKIRQICKSPEADVHFITGGTQTNVVAIDALLQSYEGVLSTITGHIAVHEAGAVEATGHKVITLPEHNGKISVTDVENYLKTLYVDETSEHQVQPGMLYITHPTEVGTLYSLNELTEISRMCHHHHLKLFLDGARLGYGLAATETDITLPDIAKLCDAFYIGGTKVGALIGEALVFPRPDTVSHFFSQIKRHGFHLAKGWIIGLQFDTLFTDNLYFKISRHTIELAEKLRQGIQNAGLKFFIDSPTNQQFVICSAEQTQKLRENVDFEIWENLVDGSKAIRFCVSWHTTEEQIDQLVQLLKETASSTL
jgi:threonine aldolase